MVAAKTSIEVWGIELLFHKLIVREKLPTDNILYQSYLASRNFFIRDLSLIPMRYCVLLKSILF